MNYCLCGRSGGCPNCNSSSGGYAGGGGGGGIVREIPDITPLTKAVEQLNVQTKKFICMAPDGIAMMAITECGEVWRLRMIDKEWSWRKVIDSPFDKKEA